MPQQLAEPPSAAAPVEVEGGEIGSLSCLLALALLSAPGGRVDTDSVIQTGQTSFQPNTEFVREIQRTQNQAVSDSGVPGHAPPGAAAEPALGIGKLGSRLGPPIGVGIAQEHKKKSLVYSQFIRDFAAIKARKVDFC